MFNNKVSLHSKLPNIGVTIYTMMSKLANDSGVINLSQDLTDFIDHVRR
jgi:methionine aminotransferase